MVQTDQMEELENLRKQHELLKKMLEQQQQLRALQGRQEALMAMQESAEQAISAIEDTGRKNSGCRPIQSLASTLMFKRDKQRPAWLTPFTLIVIISGHRHHRQRFRPQHHFRTE